MGSIFLPDMSVTKMAFTDLVPFLTGSSGTSLNVAQNVQDFFKNQKPSANLASTFQQYQENFQSWDFIVGQVRNPVVQLFLNPDTISVNKRVLHDKKQTRGGFIVQFWGHDLETIEVKAATAYFQISKEPLAAFELLKRQCYQGRYHATQPYRGSPIIAMLFESQVLKGYFTNFEYALSAAQPYQFTYGFGFTVTENVTFALGSNISNLVTTAISAVKKGNTNANQNQSDVSAVPDEYQFGKGWGVQLF